MERQVRGTHLTTVYEAVRRTDIDSLIRRFNKDKANGRVSLPEFLDELVPKSVE